MYLLTLVTHFLLDVRRRDVFHAAGHDARVHQIAHELERGSAAGLRRMVEQGWIIEGASALQHFLLRLKKPLLPPHIQALALGTRVIKYFFI